MNFQFRHYKARAGKMARSVKCLMQKHQYPTSDPLSPYKKTAWCYASIIQRCNKWVLGAHWLTSLTYLVSSRLRDLISTAPPHTYLQIHKVKKWVFRFQFQQNFCSKPGFHDQKLWVNKWFELDLTRKPLSYGPASTIPETHHANWQGREEIKQPYPNATLTKNDIYQHGNIPSKVVLTWQQQLSSWT